MKVIRIPLLLLLSLLLISSTDYSTDPEDPKPDVAEKNFYFSAWGDVGRKLPKEEQLDQIKRLTDAGLTDLLPNVGVERLKELIAMGKDYD